MYPSLLIIIFAWTRAEVSSVPKGWTVSSFQLMEDPDRQRCKYYHPVNWEFTVCRDQHLKIEPCHIASHTVNIIRKICFWIPREIQIAFCFFSNGRNVLPLLPIWNRPFTYCGIWTNVRNNLNQLALNSWWIRDMN